MKLTKRIIDTLAYAGDGANRCVYWDDALANFGVRVYPTGRKTFVLSYRAGGRKRLMALGAFGVLTLEQARTLAKRKLTAILDGVDPLADRYKHASGETVQSLCAAYLDRYARTHKKTWAQDERRINKHLLPVWSRRKAHSITRADVAALHSKIGADHPYEANRTLNLISKVFEQGRRWGFIPDGFRNPAQGIDRFREYKRDRYITSDELPRLAMAIDAELSPFARAALWLYLLTGARKSELLALRWDDIDETRQELRFAETKAGRVHYLPITAAAMAILKEIPRFAENPYVFPGNKGGHLADIRNPWNRVRKAAGVEDVRLHDLRRTVGSWLAQAGNSLHLIGRVLNHSNQATTAIYARFGEDNVRLAMEAHSQKILGAAGKLASAEVIPIDPKTKKG